MSNSATDLDAPALQFQHPLHERMNVHGSCFLQQGFNARASVRGKEAEVDFVSLLDRPEDALLQRGYLPRPGPAAAFFTTALTSAEGVTIPLSVWKATRNSRRSTGAGITEGHGHDGGVVPIDAGNYRKDQRQVFHVSRQRPDLPERIEQAARAGEVARAWNSPRGRLDAGDSRAVRREAHASPGIASQAERANLPPR